MPVTELSPAADSLDHWRIVLGAGVLLALWLLESLAPMYHAARDRRVHAARNLALGAMNGVVAATALVAITVAAIEASRRAGFGLLRWDGLALPAAAQWVIALVALDGAQYLAHIAFHKTPLLWRIHAVHHHDTDVDVTTAARFHPLEIAAHTLFLLPVIVLLGLGLAHVVVYEILLLATSMFHHANLRMPRRLDRALRLLIVTPRMHWVHHSEWQPETDSNYGSVLSVWDRLFGTFRLRADPASIRFGLEGFARRDTRTLRGMLVTPLLRRRARLGDPPRAGLDGEERDSDAPRRRRRSRPAPDR